MESIESAAKLAKLFSIGSYTAFGIALICLIVAIILWFRFDIPRVFGDLTGRNAKRSIEQIRAENAKSGKKSFRPTPEAVERGTVTEPISEGSTPTEILDDETDKLDEAETIDTETEALEEATDVLGEGTEVLNGGTDVLDEGTAILSDNTSSNGFTVTTNVIETHTSEKI